MKNEMDLSILSLDSLIDTAILRHAYAANKRDYCFHIEALWKENYAGQYLVSFHHCYEMIFNVITGKETILQSWDDCFVDYEKWEKAGNPEGYVWGSNFMLAYPGFSLVKDSEMAKKWTGLLGKEMKELKVEAEIFEIRLVFYNWEISKLNNEVGLISKLIHPLK
jgi:hypothetical protein